MKKLLENLKTVNNQNQIVFREVRRITLVSTLNVQTLDPFIISKMNNVSNELTVRYKSLNVIKNTLRKKSLYSKFFWFVLSGIRTEYGETLLQYRYFSRSGFNTLCIAFLVMGKLVPKSSQSQMFFKICVLKILQLSQETPVLETF